MMRILILMLMVILFTSVCSGHKVDKPDINKYDNFHTNGNLDTNEVLTIKQCQASEHHVTINGHYVDVENKCLGSAEAVGCMKAGIGCDDSLAIAQAPNGKCYFFSNLCIPNGWQMIRNDDKPNCRWSYMNWDVCPSLNMNH